MREVGDLSDAERPAWTKEESVEAKADASFAFGYWATAENMSADPSVERVETDGPRLDRVGVRGTTYLADGGTMDWVVAEVEPARRLVIDMALLEATFRFDIRFDERLGGGSVLTQRVSLFGPNATAFVEQVSRQVLERAFMKGCGPSENHL